MAWTIALVLPIAAMALALVLHALNVVPFAPLVTTLQKIVILSFAAWLLCLSAKNAGRRARIAGAVFLGAPLILAAFLFLRPDDCPMGGLLKEANGGGTPSLPVSASVASVFLAAASRACGDAETAERLERAVDAKYLRREGGLIWLDVNHEWRIGATAMRIISLAESRGSRFREMKKVD